MTDHGDVFLLAYFDGDTELWRRRAKILSPSSDSWTEARIFDLCTSWTSPTRSTLCTTTAIQSLAEQVQLLDFIDPVEDFTEEDSTTEIMSVTGRSLRHPLTESDDNGLDVGALLEKATDRFSACMDAKIESVRERMDKRIDDKVDSKLGPVMVKLSAFDTKFGPVIDRLWALEKTSTSSTRSGPSSSSDGSAGNTTGPMIFAPSYLEIKRWCSFKDRNTLGLSEGQAREFFFKKKTKTGYWI